MLKRLKSARLARVADQHAQASLRLEEERRRYEADGRRDMVLAINYELAERARRGYAAAKAGLQILRDLEARSLIGDTALERASCRGLLAYFEHNLDLPAIPLWRIREGVRSAEIRELYRAYQAREAALSEAYREEADGWFWEEPSDEAEAQRDFSEESVSEMLARFDQDAFGPDLAGEIRSPSGDPRQEGRKEAADRLARERADFEATQKRVKELLREREKERHRRRQS